MTIYFQDGGHDVISRRKVLPPGECTRSAWFIIYMRMTFKYYGVVFKVEGLRWLTRDFSQKTKITFVYYAVYVWIYASTSTQYSTVPLSFIHLNAVPYPREMLNPKCREWLTERVRRSIVCHDFNALRRTYTYAETDRQTDRQTHTKTVTTDRRWSSDIRCRIEKASETHLFLGGRRQRCCCWRRCNSSIFTARRHHWPTDRRRGQRGSGQWTAGPAVSRACFSDDPPGDRSTA